MNTKNIADALAARLGTLTVGGQTVTATASLPDTIATIALLVYPPTGELEVQTSARRNDLYTFPVRLLRDPIGTPARTDALYAWYDAIHDLVYAHLQLGLGSYVSIAEPVSMRAAIEGQTYSGGLVYDVVEVLMQVRVNEHITAAV